MLQLLEVDRQADEPERCHDQDGERRVGPAEKDGQRQPRVQEPERAVASLGVGVCVETPRFPTFDVAQSLDQIANETLPAMLAPGESTWKATVTRLAATVREESGIENAAAFVLGN